ncbi:MAG: hypothetical protein NC313_00010 [Butyrivibrio sp.]|nr:hypothetical protein [Butyrivibrio sp.]
MNMERKKLNEIYYPLHMKALEISSVFQSREGRIFKTETRWYNGHYNKDESGEYIMDYFPIPVMSVKDCCDIEIGFDKITVSTKLKRDSALAYNFDEIKVPCEAFGVDDYLSDYYVSGMTVLEFRENIRKSGEKEIGFCFMLDYDSGKDEIFKLVKLLKSKGFYY